MITVIMNVHIFLSLLFKGFSDVMMDESRFFGWCKRGVSTQATNSADFILYQKGNVNIYTTTNDGYFKDLPSLGI